MGKGKWCVGKKIKGGSSALVLLLLLLLLPPSLPAVDPPPFLRRDSVEAGVVCDDVDDDNDGTNEKLTSPPLLWSASCGDNSGEGERRAAVSTASASARHSFRCHMAASKASVSGAPLASSADKKA